MPRPEGPVARKRDYEIRPVEHRTGAQFIAAHHYARGASNTAVAMHGLFRRDTDELVGVAQWLPPTKNVAASVCTDWRGVLALSRLAIAPSEPQNAASLLIGGSIRKLRRDSRWKCLVSYADTGRGHDGRIYRATNWRDCGLVRGYPRWIDPTTGRQVAKKATHNRTYAEMEARGYRREPPAPKRKFVFPLRDDCGKAPLRGVAR